MQSNTTHIGEQLIGVWVPTTNRIPPERPWPRLVFAGRRGHFEDGDCPAIYSVDHFSYRLLAPTVLEITESSQEYLNDDGNGTARDDSWIVPRHYDLAFHTFADGLFLDIELYLGAPVLTQYYKTEEAVSPDCTPRWRLA